METLLVEYFKNYDTITDPELKFTLDTMRRISGLRMEDVAWYWENKKEVKLPSTNISNLEPLKFLTQAEELVLFSNRINNLSALKNLTNLRHLNLIGNQVVFLDGLENLRLIELFIGVNLIADITLISKLTTLKRLGLKNNKITNIKPLESLIGLVELNLSGNPLSLDEVQLLRARLPGCKVIFE